MAAGKASTAVGLERRFRRTGRRTSIAHEGQNGTIPRYAQIRHGTLEYGKDVVVLVQKDGGVVLRMYQAKVGNINTPKWRNAQHGLEAIFQVDLDPLQLPLAPTRREGVLVFNGHVQPHVEPLIPGWVEEQRRDHGRVFRLQNLDDLVFWIVSDSLANEFRIALAELGITIADAVTAPEGTPRAN